MAFYLLDKQPHTLFPPPPSMLQTPHAARLTTRPPLHDRALSHPFPTAIFSLPNPVLAHHISITIPFAQQKVTFCALKRYLSHSKTLPIAHNTPKGKKAHRAFCCFLHTNARPPAKERPPKSLYSGASYRYFSKNQAIILLIRKFSLPLSKKGNFA